MRASGRHKRNTEGLKTSAEKKRASARLRCDSALKRLLRERKAINFRAVAIEAKVSLAWLYKQEDFRRRIEQLRSQYQPAKVEIPKPERASESSWKAKYEAVHKRNQELSAELKELRLQLETAYGIIAAKGLETDIS